MAKYLIYSGVKCPTQFPASKPVKAIVERAEYCDDESFGEVFSRVSKGQLITAVVHIHDDPIKFAEFIHPAHVYSLGIVKEKS